MLSTIKLKKDFDLASSTGTPIVILKKQDRCDCYSDTELLDSEPNSYCNKCYGTGYKRNIIITSNIRHEVLTSNFNNYEKTVYNTSINDYRIFFMPQQYSFLTTEDLIANIDVDNNTIIALYKIVNKERYNAEDFVYYEIYGKKLNFTPEIEVELNG